MSKPKVITSPSSPVIKNKFTGLLVFDGTDCNPNGDPDNEGAPRVCDVSGQGLKSPQSTTHRIYEVVQSAMRQEDGSFGVGYELQIRRGTTIVEGIERARTQANGGKGKEKDAKDRKAVAREACKIFYDTRMGGAVLNVGSDKADGVNGVVTFAFGRSKYPVNVRRDSLTRVCATNKEQNKEQDMGGRYAIAHAVYTQQFFVNAHHAVENEATMRDLAIYIHAMVRMFEFKRSVMGGVMNVREIFLFRHDSSLGSAPEHSLFERVLLDSAKGSEAMAWSDYSLRFNDANLPSGIKVFRIENMLGSVEDIERVLTP